MTQRILSTVVAACMVGLVTFFVPTALAIRTKNQHQDLLEMQRLAATAASGLPSGEIDRWLGSLGGHPDHSYAVYGPGGERLAGNGPARADQVTVTARAAGLAADRTATEVVAAASSEVGGRPGLVVRVAEPLRESLVRTAAEMAWLLALASAALGVAVLAGWWLVRRLLRPMRGLHRAAVEAGHGAVVASVPPTGLPEIDAVGSALVASHRRLLSLLAGEKAFTSRASHQLRTPLTAVITALEVEEMAPRTDPQAVVRESLVAMRRLQQTVEDLLSLSRDLPPAQPAVPLSVLQDQIIETWREQFRARGRPLGVDRLPSPEPQVPRAAVAQILDVLLANALQHGGGATTLSAEMIPGGLVLAVTDQGPGPSHPETLFEHRDAHAAGTGIGLALARDLAEAEGARLTYLRGRPTRFELLLPFGRLVNAEPRRSASWR